MTVDTSSVRAQSRWGSTPSISQALSPLLQLVLFQSQPPSQPCAACLPNAVSPWWMHLSRLHWFLFRLRSFVWFAKYWSAMTEVLHKFPSLWLPLLVCSCAYPASPQRHDSTRVEIIFHMANMAIYKAVNFSQWSDPWPFAPALKQDKQKEFSSSPGQIQFVNICVGNNDNEARPVHQIQTELLLGCQHASFFYLFPKYLQQGHRNR